MDLADAINGAFGRWDRAHLSVFRLKDGRVVTDEETGTEMIGLPGGPLVTALDIESTKVGKTLALGAEFQYVFDLGDNWTHRCVVEVDKVDPVDVLGIRPGKPLAYWGWGSIPDQYGRRWADDDGEGPRPPRPAHGHPMLSGLWPAADELADVALGEVRAAIATAEADRFLAAVSGCEIDHVLQQVGAGLSLALDQRRAQVEPLTVSLIGRLHGRDWPGDEALAEDLLAQLRGEPPNGRPLPVDLEMLSMELEGDVSTSTGGYLDLRTGEVVSEAATDPMMVGEDDAVDVDAEPGRWLWIERIGPRDGWQDMAAFAELQLDPPLRERLERAIEGKGSFRRFRDVVHADGLVDQWRAFATDREWGRAREFLAAQGIRVR